MKKVIKREREREIKGRKLEFTFEDNGNPAANTSDDSMLSLSLLTLDHLTLKVTLFSFRRKIRDYLMDN